MLNVYITMDTEVWWSSSDLKNIQEDFNGTIKGITPYGDFGVQYQIDIMNRYGIKGVYFIEPLFAKAVGQHYLEDIVGTVQDNGHDAQLHIHTEWLQHQNEINIEILDAEHIRYFNLEQQEFLIKAALDQLYSAGAKKINAFRAGNYGADFNTLKALAKNEIIFDSSYNYCFLDSACGLDLGQPLLQPKEINGVWEIPINYIEDWPGHHRPMQLNACSFREIEHALFDAWQKGWESFVIVSHSFELLNAERTSPNNVVIDRFDKLCQLLAEHTDKFHSQTFTHTKKPEKNIIHTKPTKGLLHQTLLRFGEQAISRMQ